MLPILTPRLACGRKSHLLRLCTQRAGPRLDREQLLDRYHSHTEHCAACSGALQNVERGLQLSLWAGFMLAFAAAVYAATALGGGMDPSTLSGSTGGQGGVVKAAGKFLLSAARLFPAGCCASADVKERAMTGCAALLHMMKAFMHKAFI